MVSLLGTSIPPKGRENHAAVPRQRCAAAPSVNYEGAQVSQKLILKMEWHTHVLIMP